MWSGNLAWSIEWDERAVKELRALDVSEQRRILRFLREKILVCDDPRRYGAPLHGAFKGLWKYRVGDYRVICSLEDDRVTVLVLRVGHRRNVYG